jgi:hypothetical protein
LREVFCQGGCGAEQNQCGVGDALIGDSPDVSQQLLWLVLLYTPRNIP